MPKCRYNPKLRCPTPDDCANCDEFKKSGQQSLWAQNAFSDKKTATKSKEVDKGTGITSKFEAIGYDKEYACPFCLGVTKLQDYLIRTKHGYHQGLGECPECKNKMQFKSLLAEWTPEQYADWVYAYIADGFWQKCRWEQWKERLKQMGWAQAFWARYKELKGEGESETYEEQINRQAYEQYVQEHGEEE